MRGSEDGIHNLVGGEKRRLVGPDQLQGTKQANNAISPLTMTFPPLRSHPLFSPLYNHDCHPCCSRGHPLSVNHHLLSTETTFNHLPVTIPMDAGRSGTSFGAAHLPFFLRIWASVHPNIPSPDERWPRIAFRRVGLMLGALIVPEAIIAWA